jgi:hypothetical protein
MSRANFENFSNKMYNTKYISASGWYRIACQKGVKGGIGIPHILLLKSQFDYNSNCSYVVNIAISYGNADLRVGAAAGADRIIEKVRIVKESDNFYYYEVYISNGRGNNFTYDFLGYESNKFEIINFEASPLTGTVIKTLNLVNETQS